MEEAVRGGRPGVDAPAQSGPSDDGHFGPDGVLAAGARPGRSDLGEALRAAAGHRGAPDAVEAVPRPVDRGLVQGARPDEGHRAVREGEGPVARSVRGDERARKEDRGPADRAGAPGVEPAVAQSGDGGGETDRRAGGPHRAARGFDHRRASTSRQQGAPVIGKTIAEVSPGDHAELVRQVEEDDIASFIDAVGDLNPVHSDGGYAAATPSKAHVVYEERPRRVASLTAMALGPWALAAQAVRLWAAMVTSAVRR